MGKAVIEVSDQKFSGLVRYNVIAGIAHAVQAIAIIALSNDFKLPVVANYIQGPPGTTVFEQVTLFEVPVGIAVALFSLMSAVAHFIVATVRRGQYRSDLSQQQNIARWVEYSLSSTLMILLIAQVTSVIDGMTLLAIAGANVSMILFGWLQEKYESPGGGLLPFWFGCIAGIVPWLVFAFLLIAPGNTTGAEPPAFVYGIVLSLFAFFNSFALNQWLQYKQVGKWRDYLYGERVYITLSLVAKSLLAWQIFAGTLVPA